MTKNLGLKPFYERHGITLYNAKFEDVLPQLLPGSIDLLLTDPPYATTNLSWDKAIDWPFFWTEAHRLVKPRSPMVLFASGQFVNRLINSNPKHFRYELIWQKNHVVGFLDARRRPLRSHENIIVFSQEFRGSTYNPQMSEGRSHIVGKGNGKRAAHYAAKDRVLAERKTNLYYPRSVLNFSRDSKSLHPTQKPLALMKWLVETYSNRGETILEPFAGSGSTLVAAVKHGRRAIAVEQSYDYCKILVDRINSQFDL